MGILSFELNIATFLLYVLQKLSFELNLLYVFAKNKLFETANDLIYIV